MAWRWISTPLSADRGEVSVLAIVETIIAMSISLGIARYWQTLTHIAVSACVAPFLLLRSKRSVLLGIVTYTFLSDRFDRLLGLIDKKHHNSSGLIKFFNTLIIGIFGNIIPLVNIIFPLFARLYAIILTFFDKFVFIFCFVPENWLRYIFSVDLGNPPEIIPGIERLKKRFYVESFEDFSLSLSKIFARDERFTKIDDFMGSLIAFIYVFIPKFIMFVLSVLYRWSLKSTALIWSPLLWIIVTARTIGPVRFRLQNICNTALYKIMRWYSVATLILFTAKLVIWLGPQTVALNSSLRPLLEPFIEPARLPLWQVGSATSALLAIGLYLLADWHLKQIEADRPDRSAEQTIKWQIGAITVIRNTLALYTIACMLYIAWKISAGIEWPVLEFVLFPWS